MKWVTFAVGSVFLVAAAVFTAVKFGSFEVGRLQKQVDRLEQDRQRLLEYAERVGASRRVAQVDVVRERRDEAGRVVHTLLWQEIGADGTLGRPATVEVIGGQAYFEALVIKFEQRLVGEGDAERGTSLALFRRIFGDQQMPESAAEIDRALRPLAEREERTPGLRDELWGRFWEMIDDPALAARYGVRVVQCEAPAVPIKPGQVWEVTIDAAGGLNVKKLGTRTESGSAREDAGRSAHP